MILRCPICAHFTAEVLEVGVGTTEIRLRCTNRACRVMTVYQIRQTEVLARITPKMYTHTNEATRLPQG